MSVHIIMFIVFKFKLVLKSRPSIGLDYGPHVGCLPTNANSCRCRLFHCRLYSESLINYIRPDAADGPQHTQEETISPPHNIRGFPFIELGQKETDRYTRKSYMSINIHIFK